MAKKKKVNVPLKLVFEAVEETKYNKNTASKKRKEIHRKNQELNKALKTCSFRVSNFEDNRQNKATIGTNFRSALLIDDVKPWLNDASEHILKKKLETNDVASRMITVEPKLTRLYSYAQNMNIHGVSALHVDFKENGAIVDSRHYRSLGSTVNWNNGSHEYLDAVETSLEQVYSKLLYDLANFCNADAKEYTAHALK